VSPDLPPFVEPGELKVFAFDPKARRALVLPDGED